MGAKKTPAGCGRRGGGGGFSFWPDQRPALSCGFCEDTSKVASRGNWRGVVVDLYVAIVVDGIVEALAGLHGRCEAIVYPWITPVPAFATWCWCRCYWRHCVSPLGWMATVFVATRMISWSACPNYKRGLVRANSLAFFWRFSKIVSAGGRGLPSLPATVLQSASGEGRVRVRREEKSNGQRIRKIRL